MTVAPLSLLFAALLACAPTPDKVVTNEVHHVACGTCQYKIPEGVGCYWAIDIEGEHYPVAGEYPRDHENHAPDGMCNMERSARVSGELRGQNFIASSFELLPAQDVPSEPTFSRDDDHGADYRAPHE